jgi:FkbM family methyltransferase
MKSAVDGWLPTVVLVIAAVLITTNVLTARFEARYPQWVTEDFLIEVAPFVNKQAGGPKYSRFYEELIIRDFFQDRRDGVFLDVGANHYRDESNTFYLESVLGWSGLAVEALPEFEAGYKTHRPKTRYVAMFASDVDGTSVPFFVPTDQERKLVASASESWVNLSQNSRAITVPTATLNTVLQQAGVSSLDFMSMDIELAEPKALAGFDIDRYRPALVCIEGQHDVRQEILNYFQRHGYVLIGRYLRADVKNLYFTPAS